MERTKLTSRAGWAQTLTLGALVLASAAGAVWSAGRSGPECGEAAGKCETVKLADCRPGTACATSGLGSLLAKVDDAHRAMIEKRAATAGATRHGAKMSACFTPGTPNEVMEAFRAIEAKLNNFGDRFNIGPRWTSTAYTPGGSALGKPVTISWSIVPDGTDIQGFNGETDSPSDLRAFLNGIYGSEAVWLPLLQSVFDRWEQVSGIDYVYEPNDDGAALRNPEDPMNPGTFLPSTAFGVVGVRGDVRISGHLMNGPGGVLAYNFYPDSGDATGGDMVIDTGDTFYTTASNSVRLRNVVSHEHGHGMGQPHVCPIETTKLMEPFASAVFDGPRHDDIRHAQFSYGDIYEPNDQEFEATPIAVERCGTVVVGTLPAPAGPTAGVIHELSNTSTVSLSDENDNDYYAITVPEATTLTVTMRPLGLAYDDSSQACSGNSGSCCSGDPIDSRTTIDAVIQLFDVDGTSSLALAASAPAGESETLTFTVPVAGTYYIQIKDSLATATAQFYDLTIQTRSAVLEASVAGDAESVVPAGALVPVGLNIADGSETFDLDASDFFYRINGGPIVEAPIYDHGGGAYVAALADVPCSGTVEWFAVVRSTLGSFVRLPCSGFNVARTGSISDVYSTDFTTNAAGWTVGPNTATSGIWERVSPIGSIAQPGRDRSDTDDLCFVTGQGAIGNGAGAFDVDGGSTILVSPTLNLTGQSEAEISYWRWYSNGAGGGPFGDTFVVQVSSNGGGSWTTVQTIGPGSESDPNVNPGWRSASFTLPAFGVVLSANMKVRFNAQDTGTGSVVEAAVDDFAVSGFACTPVAWCVGDLNLDGLVEDADFVGFAFAYNVLDCADPTMPVGCPSDLNNDGSVDDSDFVLFAAAYNELVCP